MALGTEGAAIAKGEALAYLEPHNERCPCFKGGIVQAEQGDAHWDTSNLSCFHKLIWVATWLQGM